MKSIYRYINADGDLIEEQTGDPGNYSIIPEGAVVVQEVEMPGWHPRRGDEVEAWLKRLRDKYPEKAGAWWAVLDDALDDYRLHADTGTPLSEDVEVQ